ncbi:hypothetical protein REH65_33050 (plasmid) [Saccharopolyspora sp. ID03-671]|uniref:hypothetical protein n=1 Tax=Saccharopolyspora sp. ID03-671 TaxID=3073066 RepID=UPI0032539DAE
MCATSPTVAGASLIGSGAASIAGSAFDSWMKGMADALVDAMGKILGFLWTWWIHIPTPGISATAGPVSQVQHHLAWYMMVAAGIGLLVGAGKLALSTNGGQELRETGLGLGRWVLLSTAGTAGVGLLVQAGDEFSTWIIQRAAGKDLAAAVGSYLVFSAPGSPGMTPTLVIILAIIAIFAAFIQAALMFVRAGMLVLCAGVLPLAAAAGIGGGAGKKTMDKLLSWMIAFVLFKPVAAVVYAATFWTIGASDANAQIAGLFMLVLASCALPALMRVITPQVESLTSSGGNSGAGMAAGQAAASGARMLTSGSGRTNGASAPSRGGAYQPGLAAPSGATGSGPRGPVGPSGSAGLGAAGGGGAAGAGAGAGAAAAGPAGAVAAGGAKTVGAVKQTAQGAAEHGANPNDQQPPPSGGSQNPPGGSRR